MQNILCGIPELRTISSQSIPRKSSLRIQYLNLTTANIQNYQLVITEFALQNPAGGQADQ
jgi:hypothetical protein